MWILYIHFLLKVNYYINICGAIGNPTGKNKHNVCRGPLGAATAVVSSMDKCCGHWGATTYAVSNRIVSDSISSDSTFTTESQTCFTWKGM
jgi:hypothetical protein